MAADFGYRDINQWAAERRTALSRLAGEMEIDETFVDAAATWNTGRMESYLYGLPKGLRAKVPPLAKDAVDIAVNQVFVGESPEVRVMIPPKTYRDPQKGREIRENLERKLQALLWYIETYTTETPLRSFTWDTLGLGQGVLWYPLSSDRWPADPFRLKDGRRREPKNAREREQERRWKSRRFRSLPWDVRSLHPRRVLFDTYNDPPEDVIVEEQVSLRKYAQRFPHVKATASGLQQNRAVPLLTYCSADWYGLWLDEQPLLTKKEGADEDGIAENTWGVLWAKFGRSGFGRQTYNGEWEYRIRGILRDVRDVIAMYVSAVNQVEAIRGAYAFPPMDISGPEHELAMLDRIVFGPAVIYKHSEQVRIKAMELPQVPPVVLQSIDMMQRFLEIHVGPEILRGVREGPETALGHEGRLSQAKAPLRPSRQSCQQGVAGMLMDMCQWVEHHEEDRLTFPDIGENIIELGPEDIPQVYRVTVNFAPPTSEEKARRQAERYQKMGNKVISRRHAMEWDDEIDDVEDELAEIYAETLLEQPALLEIVSQQASQQLRERLGLPEGPAEAPEPIAAQEPQGAPSGAGSLNGAGPLGSVPVGEDL